MRDERWQVRVIEQEVGDDIWLAKVKGCKAIVVSGRTTDGRREMICKNKGMRDRM